MELRGAATYLQEAQDIDSLDVEEEQNEEIDSLLAACDLDDRQAVNSHYLREPDAISKRQKTSIEELTEHLDKASEQVVVESTLAEYRR